MRRAAAAGLAIPAFNAPHLPMVAPLVKALRDTETLGFIEVARLEWEKFGAQSLEAVRAEYERFRDARHTRLHLDHVPVIDEDGLRVDYRAIILRALDASYDSVMVDGSRLPLEENIRVTAEVVALAHAWGVPVEAELGAVLGHEAGPLPTYEDLFASGRGFTDVEEARRFVAETGVDWLSVAFGNVHGAIAGAAKSAKKLEARLNVAHLAALRAATEVPLVLHGGTGIRPEDVRAAVRGGIAKINIGTLTRQAYERALATGGMSAAQEAVYAEAVAAIEKDLQVAGSARRLGGPV